MPSNSFDIAVGAGLWEEDKLWAHYHHRNNGLSLLRIAADLTGPNCGWTRRVLSIQFNPANVHSVHGTPALAAGPASQPASHPAKQEFPRIICNESHK